MAVLSLSTNNWDLVKGGIGEIRVAIDAVMPGKYAKFCDSRTAPRDRPRRDRARRSFLRFFIALWGFRYPVLCQIG